jgi:organic radical activating enzyme
MRDMDARFDDGAPLSDVRARLPALPLNRLYIEYTNHCNMACSFCPCPRQTRPKGHLTLDLLKRIADEIAEKQIATTLEVTGYGEPLMNPHWRALSEYIIGRGIHLNLTTNGTMFSEKNAEALAEVAPDDVIVSLQTPDEKSWPVRKSAMSFADYLDGLARFLRIHAKRRATSRVRLRFLNTLGTKRMTFSEPVSVLDTRAALVESLHAWAKRVCDWTGHACDESRLARGLQRVGRVLPTALRVTDKVVLESYFCNDYWNYALGKRLEYPARFARCKSLNLESALIYHDGRVSLCCSDFDNHLGIGSVERHSLLEVLGSRQAAALVEGFRKFRVIHPYCQHCLGANSRLLALSKALGASLYLVHLSEYREVDVRA